MTLPAYHNTVPEPRVVREAYDRDAKSKRAAILRFFRARPREEFTREQIEAAFNLPTQSVSGRLAELKELGFIEFTGNYATGRCGRRINCWRLARHRPAPVVQAELPLTAGAAGNE